MATKVVALEKAGKKKVAKKRAPRKKAVKTEVVKPVVKEVKPAREEVKRHPLEGARQFIGLKFVYFIGSKPCTKKEAYRHYALEGLANG